LLKRAGRQPELSLHIDGNDVSLRNLDFSEIVFRFLGISNQMKRPETQNRLDENFVSEPLAMEKDRKLEMVIQTIRSICWGLHLTGLAR
jgi:hypothetical protein